MDQWTNGPMDQWSNAPIDQWTSGLFNSLSLLTQSYLVLMVMALVQLLLVLWRIFSHLQTTACQNVSRHFFSHLVKIMNLGQYLEGCKGGLFQLLEWNQSTQWCTLHPCHELSCLIGIAKSVFLPLICSCWGRCSDRTWRKKCYNNQKAMGIQPLFSEGEKISIVALAVCLWVCNIKLRTRHNQGWTGSSFLKACKQEFKRTQKELNWPWRKLCI